MDVVDITMMWRILLSNLYNYTYFEFCWDHTAIDVMTLILSETWMQELNCRGEVK